MHKFIDMLFQIPIFVNRAAEPDITIRINKDTQYIRTASQNIISTSSDKYAASALCRLLDRLLLRHINLLCQWQFTELRLLRIGKSIQSSHREIVKQAVCQALLTIRNNFRWKTDLLRSSIDQFLIIKFHSQFFSGSQTNLTTSASIFTTDSDNLFLHTTASSLFLRNLPLFSVFSITQAPKLFKFSHTHFLFFCILFHICDYFCFLLPLFFLFFLVSIKCEPTSLFHSTKKDG